MSNNINIIELRLNKSGTRESAEDMTFLFLEPLMDSYGIDNTKGLFIQCMSAYDSNIGCIYILSENDCPLAFAFVLDKYNTIEGVPHLNIFSVYKSRQHHGFGSILMSTLVNKIFIKDGLTLECKKNNVPFFKKNGFETRQEVLANNHVSMYVGLAKYKTKFKKPIVGKDKVNEYMLDYETCQKRLINKKMLKLKS